ncbi:MAG: hypothetical protein C0391_00050 [Anaerolinea sp.]|nr:hypothetical protein [Anaerolinea sp.]
MSTEEPTQNKRGGCLTVFLIVLFIVSPLYILISVVPPSEQLQESLPNWPVWAMYLMGLLGLLNLVSAIAMWKWKKWGAFVFASAVTIFFGMSILRGAISPPGALFGLAISIAVLVRILKPVWQKMK